MSDPTHPAPGWYEDPQGTGTRYWDGTQWTDDRVAADEARSTPPEVAAGASSPWHERSVVRIGALVAGVLGVAMLAMGVVAYLGSSDTSDEADGLTAQAEDVQSEADAVEAETEQAQAVVEELPGLTADLNAEIQSSIEALDATVLQYNLFLACVGDAADNQAFNVCVDTFVPPFNAALAAELEASSQLQTTLNDAEDAVTATTGGGTEEEEEGS